MAGNPTGNPTDYTPYAIGLSGVSTLLNTLFGGNSDQDENLRAQTALMRQRQQFGGQLFPQLQGMLNNPSQFMANNQRAMQPQMNKFANSASQRAGLDSGAGQGALAKYGMGLAHQGYMGNQSQLLQMLSMLSR